MINTYSPTRTTAAYMTPSLGSIGDNKYSRETGNGRFMLVRITILRILSRMKLK